MAAFRLSKWYFDCVTDSGDVSIVYTGSVNWGILRLHYSSLLQTTAGLVSTRHSLRRQKGPTVNEQGIDWQSSALDLRGTWRPDSTEVRETVYESGDGSVDWHCLMPRAKAQVGGRSGFGYAEHLTMTISPWKLPIQCLRWGRFASVSDWIVWIDWQGKFSRRIVHVNGSPVSSDSVEDGRLRLDDGRHLAMDRSLVIREGSLGSTVLSPLSSVRKKFPSRLLQIEECKWRSRAQLVRPGQPAVEGWAIHEKVCWPK